VPLADPAGILEAVADRAAQSDGVADLIEAARRVLAPTITRMCASADGAIDALTLGPNAERYIREARESADPGEATALPVKAIATLRAQTDGAPGETVLLCTPEARRSIRAALGDSRPDLKVISSEEIVGSARVRVVAQVDIPADVLDEGARPRVRADGTDGEIP
jgi:flagellar biosynthesis component FlhA